MGEILISNTDIIKDTLDSNLFILTGAYPRILSLLFILINLFAVHNLFQGVYTMNTCLFSASMQWRNVNGIRQYIDVQSIDLYTIWGATG